MSQITLSLRFAVIFLCATSMAQSQDMLRERVAQQISVFAASAVAAKHKRNAQNLSSVCAAAQAAGHDFTAGAKNKSAVVERLITGVKVQAGAFDGVFFGVTQLKGDDAKDAAQHLELVDGVLRYVSDATTVDDVKPAEAGMNEALDIVLACASAKVFSGNDLVLGATDPAKVLDVFTQGTVIDGESYSLHLTESERKTVLPYLTVEEGILKFVHRGNVEDPTPIVEEMLAYHQEQGAIGNAREEGSPKARRNAQNLLSVCTAAQAAGWDFVQGETSVVKVVSNIVLGKEIPSGVFEGKFFGVPSISEADQRATYDHLYVEDGILRYSSRPRLQQSASAESDPDL